MLLAGLSEERRKILTFLIATYFRDAKDREPMEAAKDLMLLLECFKA